MNDYEQVLALMKSRRSIRQFAARSIAREDLPRLIEAARWAPSNHNRQPWRFLVLEDKQEITRLAENIGRKLSEKLLSLPAIASGYAEELTHYATFFSQAPVVVVAMHKRPVSVSDVLLAGVPQPALVSGEPLSVAMAVQNLLLAAHALGLGACVLTAPLIVQEVVRSELELPFGYELTCFVALGYPEEQPPTPRRKSIEQIVNFRKDSHHPEKINDDRNGNI